MFDDISVFLGLEIMSKRVNNWVSEAHCLRCCVQSSGYVLIVSQIEQKSKIIFTAKLRNKR